MNIKNQKIFINYRREDEQNIVFALANSLMREYGVGNIFYDRQAIPIATAFPDKIDAALDQCAILIVIIGKQWLDILNQRRVLDGKDYVLLEIEHAIQKGKLVLPVLLDETPMPSADLLPGNVKALSLLNAVRLSTKDLHSSVKILVAELNDLLQKTPVEPPRPPLRKWVIGVSFIVVFTIAVVVAVKKIPLLNTSKTTENISSAIPMNDDTFRAKVLTTIALIKSDPINNSSKQIKQLQELIEIEQKYPYYAENLKTETSLLNRAYGAAKIIDGQDPSIKPSVYFQEAFVYIKRSHEVGPEIWKGDLDQKAFNYMSGIDKNLEKTDFTNLDFIKEYLKNVIIISMYGSTKEEIDTQVNGTLAALTSTTDVLQFFADYPVGNTTYRLLVEAIKMLLKGMGSDLKGPVITNQGKNIFYIDYWLIDSKGNRKDLIWAADMSGRSVNPANEDARVFTEAIKNKK